MKNLKREDWTGFGNSRFRDKKEQKEGIIIHGKAGVIITGNSIKNNFFR